MKKHLLFLSLLLTTLTFFIACQKELSVETGGVVSQGSLQLDGGTGDCLPKTIGGIYEEAKVLNGTTNYIEVQVDVTSTGSYLIYTDTTNGYFFRASGIFTSTGMSTIRLKASGTPVSQGIDNFVVAYGTSVCLVSVNVVPPGGGTPAVFTLNGAPGTCADVASTITGNYVVGVALTSANTATLKVNVTTTGVYNITTTASNGIVFSGTGSLTGTGAQTIPLTASGTPLVAGPANIVIPNGISPSCSFVVTCTAAPVVTGDYFPLTANSWWSYDDDDGLFVDGDSLTRKNIDQITLGGNVYRIFQNQDETTPTDSSFFRKVGSEYREITLADYYTSSGIIFDVPASGIPVIGEIPFVKEGLATGTTWKSPEYSGTTGGGSINMKVQYAFTCTDANATVTINGHVFTNVYKISWKPTFSLIGSPYQDDVISWDSYYAKGVGLIYLKINDLIGGQSAEIKIKHWQVL